MELYDYGFIVGDFALSQTVTGKIAWFNMWDEQFSKDELNQLRCRGEGNVVTMNDFQHHGSVVMHEETFPCIGKLHDIAVNNTKYYINYFSFVV